MEAHLKGLRSMNRIYRLVWNRVTNAWVSKGSGKSSSGRKSCTIGALASNPA